MKELRGNFDKILTEAQHVAGACGITPELIQGRQTKLSTDDLTPEKEFPMNVFLPILDSVIAGLSTIFNATKQINSTSNSCGCTGYELRRYWFRINKFY